MTFPSHDLINYASKRTLIEGNTIPAIIGKCSWFGGPDDRGVTPTETGAISGEVLRKVDPEDSYVAMRFSYDAKNADRVKKWLRTQRVVVYGPNGHEVCRCSDWGPHRKTGRIVDLSPGTMRRIGSTTDSVVVVHWDTGEEWKP